MSESSPQAWKVLAQRELYDGSPWLRLLADDVLLPRGETIKGFYQVAQPDFAMVVALTTDNLVVAQYEYKHGPGKVTIQLPAGYIEPGEDPLTAAQRELAEETGYESSDWQFLGKFVNDGNRGFGTGHYFLARNARRTHDPHLDDGEEIAVFLTSLPELTGSMMNGDVAVATTAAAIGLAVIALAEL